MTVNELEKIDESFNYDAFMSKVNNIFVKFLTAIMMDKLNEVDHFVSDEVYKYGMDILTPLKSKNHRQMYDELNVKSTTIRSIDVTDEEYIISVFIESRYMNYILDLNTGNTVSGNDSSRIQVNYNLIFVKKIDTKNQGVIKKCSFCGAPMDVNYSGFCEYCRSVYEQENYDWVLDKINVVY